MGIAMVLLWYCYGIAMEGLECCYGGRDFLSNTWGSNLNSQFSGSFQGKGKKLPWATPLKVRVGGPPRNKQTKIA